MGATLYEPINVYKPLAPNIGVVDGPFEYFTVAGIRFFRDDISLGLDTNAPYSLTVTGLTAGSYVFSVAALFSTGELETTDPVHLTVLSPHDHTPVPLSATVQGSTVVLSLPAEDGAQWRIEYSDSAPSGPWTTLETITGNGTIMTVNDSVTNSTHRFYRAVLEH